MHARAQEVKQLEAVGQPQQHELEMGEEVIELLGGVEGGVGLALVKVVRLLLYGSRRYSITDK